MIITYQLFSLLLDKIFFRRTKNYLYIYIYNENQYKIYFRHSLLNEWVFRRTTHSYLMITRFRFQLMCYSFEEIKIPNENKTFDLSSVWSVHQKKKISFLRSDLIRSSREPFRLLFGDVNGLFRIIIWTRWVNCFRWFSSSRFLN